MGLAGYMQEHIILWLKRRRKSLTREIYAYDPILGFINFIAIGLVYTVFAVASCQFISEYARGGGYVEIKCVLCGGNTTDAFELKCFVAKYLSTSFMAASGLPLGTLASNIQYGTQIAFNL